MRDIRFRGCDAETGDWHYGYYYRGLRNHIIIDEDKKEHVVIGDSVTWSIGLTDKNGKEIFGGDIVRFWTQSTRGSISGITEVVEYHDGAWMPFWDGKYIQDEQGDWFEDNTIEVIGNIYENQDLLTNKDN